uniref:PID domain-containing protein n=1 Tax=Macrostomum lignano TaxID=282301 RepID=A0A1I8FJ02_9PLAT
PKIRSGGQSTPHFFCCYVSERVELGFLQLADFCCLGGAIKLLLLQAINQKFLTVVKFQAVRILVTMRIFIADLAQFQPPPQPTLSKVMASLRVLAGRGESPCQNLRPKGYEYVVTFTAAADTTDIRSTFEGIISVLCSDLQADDFISAKLTRRQHAAHG